MITPFTLNLQQGVLAVEPIGELAQLESKATMAELKSVEGITAQSRRAERLAWRRTLRRIAGEECEVSYTKQGAPRITNSRFEHISVSHCADCVAVLLAESPCGVDVERTNRNFERVASRYITPKEQALSADERASAAIWSAKEALYKMQGREGVDFLRDMEIVSLDFEGATIKARMSDGPAVEMGIVFPDEEHIVVYTK